MPREEFLRNLRIGAGHLSPTVQVNGIRLDASHLDGILRRATIWLTPKVVEGYEESDFQDIPEADRARLTLNVEAFKTLASEIPSNGPATPEQIGRATPVFAAILSAMGPFLEGFQVYAALKRLPFPEFVVDFAVRVGRDATGDPSAWIWVIIREGTAKNALMSAVTNIQELVGIALERAGIDLYPYVLFRSRTEQLELEQELDAAAAR